MQIEGDAKIATCMEIDPNAGEGSCLSSFCFSVKDVLEKMLGLNSSDMKNIDNEGCTNGKLFVNIGFFGDISGNAFFCFSDCLALKLFKMMTFCEVDEINDMVCSAIGEIANITSGTAITDLSTRGIACDIKPPQISTEQPELKDDSQYLTIDTGIGLLDIIVAMS